ncbi:LytTR family DNA-binding domain-containing protein [Sphingomicrobium flavum]|uniref:LytTR family DNA-binding domain-containing protein n=1 Tax=Sphingomicrobium flavum TaxID=1229164 RepID=UPI0021AD79E7|nr:LytTR family DNA-binding domain-containing protein [Sphingomicrobium flavum]
MKLRQTIIDVAILLIIGLALALIGPLGTFRFDLAARIAYWLPICLLGYAIFRPTIALADHVAHRLDLPRWPTIIAALWFAAMPMSVLLSWAGDRWGQLPPFDIFLRTTLYVALIGSGIYTIFLLVERARAAPEQPVPAPPASTDAAPTSRFHDRLPARFPLPLVALENEDHYVRAHGSGGSELILMRLRDAVAELDGMDGAQVHRSWWVARDAVKEARRDGRRWILSLGDGLDAPVARERVADLRQKGWF